MSHSPRQKLILASRSPRRRQLLEEHGFDFEIVPPDERAEDGMCSGELPAEYVARLAYQKAMDVAKRYQEGLFLGCDTVAELQGRVLGKPRDWEHAREMLSCMNGKQHRVLSGVCLVQKPEQKILTRVEVTLLKMAEISEEAIEDYLDTGLWEGKAGGFGLQDGIEWIEVVEGSESNVVGLPMELLQQMLQEFCSRQEG